MAEEKAALSELCLNDKYIISKNSVSPQLVSSIKKYGVIRPSVVCRTPDGLLLLTGRNRFLASKECGLAQIPVSICSEPSWDIIKSEAVFKYFHKELGPSGKIKVLFIMTNIFGMTPDEAFAFGREIGVGESFGKREADIRRFMELPAELKNYFDLREIPFKTVRICMDLPEAAVGFLSALVRSVRVRAGIFCRIAEICSELSKETPLPDLELLTEEYAEADAEILRRLFVLRYPEYSAMKMQADLLKEKLEAGGVKIDFPEFFEKGELTVKLTVSKRQGAEAFREKAEKVNRELIQQLLDML